MADNTTLNSTAGGDVVEDIDGANGTGGIKRQVMALGGIGKSGAHTALIAGQATAANSIPVVIASDKGLPSTGPASAGSAAGNSELVGGKYNSSLPTLTNGQQAALQLDQAAGLQIVGQRPFVVKGSINNGQTTYATRKNIGGLITVATGFPGNSLIAALTIRIKALGSNVTTNSPLGLIVFDANPSSSTFTDNTTVALNSADVQKAIQLFQNVVGLGDAVATDTVITWNFNFTGRIATDGSGNIFLDVESWASSLVLASTNVLFYEVNGLW